MQGGIGCPTLCIHVGHQRWSYRFSDYSWEKQAPSAWNSSAPNWTGLWESIKETGGTAHIKGALPWDRAHIDLLGDCWLKGSLKSERKDSFLLLIAPMDKKAGLYMVSATNIWSREQGVSISGTSGAILEYLCQFHPLWKNLHIFKLWKQCLEWDSASRKRSPNSGIPLEPSGNGSLKWPKDAKHELRQLEASQKEFKQHLETCKRGL